MSKKVVIAFPARNIVETGFALDLASLAAHKIPDVTTGVNCSVGTILPDQRIDLARHALNVGASHILWLDADMRFPRDALARLLKHDKAIVAANYVTRVIPPVPVAQNYDEESGQWLKVFSADKTGLEEITGLGMGLMLTSTDVFKKLKEPWFTFPWGSNSGYHFGEDIYFCREAKAVGFSTFVDHDLSKEIRHVGSFEYRHDHTNL